MIDKIKTAVERTVGGPVTHEGSSPILESFRGETIWQGVVEIYKVNSAPPVLAYGWAVEGKSGPDYVAVKRVGPINSPLAAVRAWIVSQAKK